MGRIGVGGSGDPNCRRISGSREGTDYSQVWKCHNLPESFADPGYASFLGSWIRISVISWIRIRFKAKSGFRIHIRISVIICIRIRSKPKFRSCGWGSQNGTMKGVEAHSEGVESQKEAMGALYTRCLPDSQHFDKEQDPDPHQSEMRDPDPHLSQHR